MPHVVMSTAEGVDQARGVRIAAVEPGEGDGVRVGVTSHPATAQQALRRRYSFPVSCWSYP